MKEHFEENTNDISQQAKLQDSSINKIKWAISFLLKKWWLFMIVGFVAGVAGVLYASFQEPSYESRLSFALDDGGSSGGLSGAMSLAAQFGLNIGGGGKDIFAGDNILEIMKSRRMVERVLLSVDTFENKAYTLVEYYLRKLNKPNPKLDQVSFPVGLERARFSYIQDSVLNNVYQDFFTTYLVAQKPDRKLSIYEVKVTSTNERFTKVFTDRLVLETNKFYTEICTKKSKGTLDILEQRVANMQGNLNASISDRAATQDANLNPAFAQAQVPVLKQQTNMQVYGAAYAEMFKNLELARFQYLKEIPLMQIIDAADYPMKKIKLGKLKTGILFSIFSVLLTTLFLWFKITFKKSGNPTRISEG
jgi:uncharacterized protein involved in exopolysaccharide biosynthesis